jgi:hypothetical protein
VVTPKVVVFIDVMIVVVSLVKNVTCPGVAAQVARVTTMILSGTSIAMKTMMIEPNKMRLN